MNARSLALIHGQIYSVCIKAEAVDLQFEKFKQTLEEFVGCSNGITIDHSAPKQGTVWVGQNHQLFQVNKI